MKAMLLEQDSEVTKNPLTLTDLPDPKPGPRQIRVKVQVCGVCRTDLHVVEGELPPITRPIIPGHEPVGIVDQVGPGCSLGQGRGSGGNRMASGYLSSMRILSEWSREFM